VEKEFLQVAVRVHLCVEYTDNADDGGGQQVIHDLLIHPK
jgi:hypothetical protein